MHGYAQARHRVHSEPTASNPARVLRSDCELEARERHLAAQTWERCQQQLFLHALQPHPLTAHVLGCVWSDLAAAASEALLQAHAAGLRDLLRRTAASDAAVGPHAPPSPLCSQLLSLLACLLAAADPAVLDAYFANFLQVSWARHVGPHEVFLDQLCVVPRSNLPCQRHQTLLIPLS